MTARIFGWALLHAALLHDAAGGNTQWCAGEVYDWRPLSHRAQRLKKLERENGRLKRLVAELSPDKQILKDVAEGNF